ncbi:MAG: MarR family winged helix-turn-helix transcriptional regulator [Eubacteriales bacterium]|nr:MarR family winged helix-turn-helix transcriptional regulator [Eubacteriales bacterium]
MCKTEHIGMYINIASHQIRRSTDSFLARYGLSGIQGRILGHLDRAAQRGEDVFQRDIEKSFGIRRSSVTSVISHLEENGFVARCPVPGDARLKKLILTEKGEQTSRQVKSLLSEFESSLNSCFTEQERKELLRMLKILIDNTEHMEV